MKKQIIIGLFFITQFAFAQENGTVAYTQKGPYIPIYSEQISNYFFNHLLIDVRSEIEFSENTLPGAINIDYYKDDFRNKLRKINVNTPIVLFCGSGMRSEYAAKIAKELGFENVYMLVGGMEAYQEFLQKKP